MPQAHGIPSELDEHLKRNHTLGNAVVPTQAKYCFSVLSGLLPYTGPGVASSTSRRRAPAGAPRAPRKRARKATEPKGAAAQAEGGTGRPGEAPAEEEPGASMGEEAG